MAENTKGQNSTPVTVTQDAPMPSAEQKAPGEVGPEPAAPVAQTPQGAQPTSQGSSPETTEPSLPEGVRERTKEEFEKLRAQSEQYRAELKAEREMRLRNQGVFDSLIPKPAPAPEPTPLYDPTTGLLNERAFAETQRAAYEARMRAERAEARAAELERSSVATEDERQYREAVATYPELNYDDPKTFNKDFHVEVRRILQDSMLNPKDYGLKGTKSLTYKDAADLAKGKRTVELEQARQEGAVQAVEELSPKEQAALEAMGTPARREGTGAEDSETLRHATRLGSEEAIVARLKKIPIVGKG